jgi:hypothetical protein
MQYKQSIYSTMPCGTEVEIHTIITVDSWSEECHGHHTMSSEDTEVVMITDRETDEELFLSQSQISCLLAQKDNQYLDSEPVRYEPEFEYD